MFNIKLELHKDEIDTLIKLLNKNQSAETMQILQQIEEQLLLSGL